jgi:hypothetical protein
MIFVLISHKSRKSKKEQTIDLIVSWCSSAKLKILEHKIGTISLKSLEIQRAAIEKREGNPPDRKYKVKNEKIDFERRLSIKKRQ